jgi:hypothetical protein
MKLSDFSSRPLTGGCWTGRMHVPRLGSSRRSQRLMALVPLVLTVGLVVGACGGGGTKSSSVAASPTTTTPGRGFNRTALQPFLTCLKQHGVNIPTPPSTTTPPSTSTPPSTVAGDNGGGGRRFGGGGGGFGALGGIVGNSADAAAVQACQSQLPPGVLQQIQQGQTALQAYRSCMQDHGVTVPANGFFRGGGPGGPGGANAPGGTTPTTTAAYAAADAICRPLLPQRGPRGGGSTTTIAAQ